MMEFLYAIWPSLTLTLWGLCAVFLVFGFLMWLGRKSLWFLAGGFVILMGLLIGGVAAYFSIFGLMALFSAATWSVAVMASAIEAGKFVLAAVLHYFQHKIQPVLTKLMWTQLIVLMLITSIGVFGFLTQAHLKHGDRTDTHDTQISLLSSQIEREQNKIDRYAKQIEKLNERLFGIMEKGYVKSGMRAKPEIDKDIEELENKIKETQDTINRLEEERIQLQSQRNIIDREIGPLKYIASLIWGDDINATGRAVRIIILLIMFVFDPLAMTLFLAGTVMIHQGLISYRAYSARQKRKQYRSSKKTNRRRYTSRKAKTDEALSTLEALTTANTDVIEVATTKDGQHWGKSVLSVVHEKPKDSGGQSNDQ